MQERLCYDGTPQTCCQVQITERQKARNTLKAQPAACALDSTSMQFWTLMTTHISINKAMLHH